MSDIAQRIMITVVDHDAIPASADKTILECTEHHGIDIQYHCREGFCGACRTKLLAGQVNYTTDPLAFIDDDEILPCCCVAITDVTLQLE